NMTANCISDLKPGAKNKILEAKGNAIQANMGTGDIPYFESLLKEGSAYRITDYIGCLTRVGNIQDVGSPNKTQSKIRRLDLENLNGDVVELTLWDNMAIDFSRGEFEKMEQPVVFAVSSCKATIYADIQLSGTPATHYYFNPNVPSLEELRDQYNFKAFLTDKSATALVTFFTPNADVLTGSSCTQLVKKYRIVSNRIVTSYAITVTPLPTTPKTPGTYPRATASIGTTPCTTEGQSSDTPDPVAETTTKNIKRALFGQQPPVESKKKKE
ncbi:nucleic acid-binding, OB-fold protein, partial [Tanacetum coccineum]